MTEQQPDPATTPNGGAPDASAGGTGAPPAPASPNRAPDHLTREYRGAGIAVQWYAARCIHSARCIRAAPAVFDPARRPWIVLDGAGADAVAAAVERCPTGAWDMQKFLLEAAKTVLPPAMGGAQPCRGR